MISDRLYLHLPEREQIVNQVLDARTLAEIDAAACALREWLNRYPEDTGIREGFEGLSLMRDIAEEQEAEREEKSKRLNASQVSLLPEKVA